MKFKAVRQPFPPRTGRLLIKTLLVMKLTVILVAVTCLQVNAKGYAQGITLSLKNAQLETVFKEIEKQTGYNFFYGDVELQKARTVNLEVKEASLEKVLQLCLSNQPITYSIVDRVIILRSKESKKTGSRHQLPSSLIEIKGKVTNEKGAPVAGATISVKNTTKLTTTNENGEFFLAEVDENAVLLISHVSFETQELKITGRSELVIQLKTKVNELSDIAVIVNTGYQQLPKERATGSFDFIDNKILNQQVSTNILDRLPAIANSLTLDRRTSTPGIMIRGLSTIQGVKGPLIVVDNFPYEGDINNINPNDIENITILKDAAAASIWGTKAGNGVIVITTKKGQFNQPLRVEFNSNVTIADKPDLFYIKQMPTSDFIDVETFLYGQGFYSGQFTDPSQPPISAVVEILEKRALGQISPSDSATQIDALRNSDVRNDFNKYMYQKAVNQQYAVNVRGGSNNIAWLLSMGYDKNQNELASEYNRINIRSENAFKPVQNLQIMAGIYYTQSKNIVGKPGYGNVSTSPGIIPAYTQFADGNGNPLPVMKDYRQLYLDSAGEGKLLNWNYYPLTDYKHINNTTTIQDFLVKAGLNYKVIEGLSADVLYQYQRQEIIGQNLQDQDSYFARNLINRFSQLDRTTGQVTYKVPPGGVIDMSSSLLIAHNVRGQINFNKRWLKHNIYVITGGEIREMKNPFNSFRNYGYNSDVLTTANVDFVNMYPTFVDGSTQLIANYQGFGELLNRFVSVYGNAAYNYNEKYTISLSGRRDASNLFGVKTNDKWTPLWSVGGSWDISRESFYKIKCFPYLKLRATYGFSGNVDQSKSAVTTLNYGGNSPYTLVPFATIVKFNNPELRWEKVGMLNIGLDFKSKNNRINGSLEYYQKKGIDMFGPSPLDYTTGISGSIVKNVANIKVRGIDIALNSVNVDGIIKWTSNLIFNFNKDEVTKYYLASLQGNNFAGTFAQVNISGLEGKPVHSIFSYKWAGLDPLTGDPQGILNKDVSKNYSLLLTDSIQNLIYHGPALPTVIGSVGNTVSWKNISIEARIVYKLGYYFRRESINYYNFFGNRVGHADFAKRWQKPGDELVTDVPSMIYPASTDRERFYNGSEVTIDKGDHIRLQYINVSYLLNRESIRKLPFSNLQLYVFLNNLGLVWRANKHHIDPDYPISSIPNSKSISIGLRATL